MVERIAHIPWAQSKSTITQLQNRPKGHERDPIAKVMSELEEKAKDYKVKNIAAVEDRWLHRMSGGEKAATDPRRSLQEVFPAGEKCPGVVVMKKM
jgi:hypothetical protein